MKALLLTLLVLIPAILLATDAPKEVPKKEPIALSQETTAVCYSLLTKLNLSPQSPTFLSDAQSVDKAKKEIEARIAAEKEKK